MSLASRRLAVSAAVIAAIFTAPLADASAVTAGPAADYVVLYREAAASGVHSLGLANGAARGLRTEVRTVDAAGAARLRRDPAVLGVELDRPIRAVAAQSSAPWGLDRIDQRALPLSGTYTYPGTGSGATAYIVDSGIRSDHTEFAGRLRQGFTSIYDGRGTGDCNGHGTHVAGIAAGTTYGVAKQATLVPVRVLDCDGGGMLSGVLSGISWLINDHVSGPAIANFSLGGDVSPTLDAALQSVVADGITVVVAAGNSGTDACNTSPARTPEALTVGATDTSDVRPAWSNDGACVDLFAPGVGITSATAAGSTSIASYSGTSMAAPHVAGAAAVLLARSPQLTPAQVHDQLVAAATSGVVGNVFGATPNRLLFSASSLTSTPAPAPAPTEPTSPVEPTPAESTPVVTEPVTAPVEARPAAPTSVKAKGARRAATVKWSAVAASSAQVSHYRVKIYRDGNYVRSLKAASDVTTLRLARLNPGSFRFLVSAVNNVGASKATRSPLVRVYR